MKGHGGANEGQQRGGFSLVELLVVVVIIVLLIAIMVPVLSKAREKAKSTATAGTINSLSTALDAYRQQMNAYPANAPSNFMSAGNYGFNVMARGLVGYQEAVGDGADGPGFRVDPLGVTSGANVRGPIYGPYMTPTARNYRRFTSVQDLPNPIAPTSGPGEAHADNQGFVDAWGLPIFYMVARRGNVGQPIFGVNFNNGNTVGPSMFLNPNPDVAAPATSSGSLNMSPSSPAQVAYTIDGVTVYSRLVAYTPPGTWVASGDKATPWGVGLAPAASDIDCPTAAPRGDWRYPAAAGYMAPTKFRARIGQTIPADLTAAANNIAPAPTDRIVGQTSFLLVSAGPDNQYYTGDEIINESAK